MADPQTKTHVMRIAGEELDELMGPIIVATGEQARVYFGTDDPPDDDVFALLVMLASQLLIHTLELSGDDKIENLDLTYEQIREYLLGQTSQIQH